VKPDQTKKNKQVAAMTSTLFDRNAEKRLFREEKNVRIRDRCLVHGPRAPGYVSQAVRRLLRI